MSENYVVSVKMLFLCHQGCITATYRAQLFNLTRSLLYFKSQFSNPVSLIIKPTSLSLKFLFLSPQFLLLLFQLRLPYTKDSGVFFYPNRSGSKVRLGLSKQINKFVRRTDGIASSEGDGLGRRENRKKGNTLKTLLHSSQWTTS